MMSTVLQRHAVCRHADISGEHRVHVQDRQASQAGMQHLFKLGAGTNYILYQTKYN
jgi:hypothetical protein